MAHRKDCAACQRMHMLTTPSSGMPVAQSHTPPVGGMGQPSWHCREPTHCLCPSACMSSLSVKAARKCDRALAPPAMSYTPSDKSHTYICQAHLCVLVCNARGLAQACCTQWMGPKQPVVLVVQLPGQQLASPHDAQKAPRHRSLCAAAVLLAAYTLVQLQSKNRETKGRAKDGSIL